MASPLVEKDKGLLDETVKNIRIIAQLVSELHLSRTQ